MRVSMTIESDGVITEISREYEPALVDDVRTFDGISTRGSLPVESPSLREVADLVARSAVDTHRIQIS